MQRWESLGIEPFLYSKPEANDHSRLYEGVRRLAEYVNRGVLDWRREITEIAEKPPLSLDEEAADLIADSLSDAVRTRFFTQAATSPEWIDWLSRRGHLVPLFGTDDISEPSAVLGRWLAETFARDHANKLFRLISQHQMQLNPSFWHELQKTIGREGDKPLDKDTLARWVSLLLKTDPLNVNWYSDITHPSAWWLEISNRCNDQKLISAILQIFAAMSKSRLLLEPGFAWPSEDGDNQPSSIDVDLPLICNLHILNELWEKGLKPNLAQVAEPLLSLVVQHFEDRHRTLCMWQQPDEGDYIDRSAIEPHHQNEMIVEDIDILTDAARDSLEWLALNQAASAALWCDLLISSDIPRLRRLAVHTLSVRSDLTADAKIDWLLTHIGLYDLNAHHETFRAVKQTYPNAILKQREKLIEAVLAYRWLGEDTSKRKEYTAYKHFKWLSWLHDAERDCPLAKTKLDEIWKKYPKFKKSEHPDFIFWPKSVETKSPWSVGELLAKPADEWLEELLSFHSNDPLDEHLLQSAVGDAAKQEFKWGLDLAESLVSRENWETNLWTALIQTWSGTELDENQVRTVIHHLENANLYQNMGVRLPTCFTI